VLARVLLSCDICHCYISNFLYYFCSKMKNKNRSAGCSTKDDKQSRIEFPTTIDSYSLPLYFSCFQHLSVYGVVGVRSWI
jgi:hypothetical protein